MNKNICAFWLLAATLSLTACGGGSDKQDTAATVPASPAVFAIADGTTVLAATATQATPAGPVVQSVTKLSETPVAGNVVDVVYRLAINAKGVEVWDAQATLTAAGLGSSVVDAAATIGNASGSSVVAVADTVTVRHDKTQAFDAAAMRFSLVGTPPASSTAVAAVGTLGLNVVVGDGSGRLQVLAGTSQTYPLVVGRDAAVPADAIRVSAVGTEGLLAVTADATRVTVDARGRTAGQVTQTIKITNTLTGQHVLVPLVVEVLAPLQTVNANLTAAGLEVTTQLGALRFGASTLAAPVAVTVVVGPAGTGGQAIVINTARDVASSGITVTLPALASAAEAPFHASAAAPVGGRARVLAAPANPCASLLTGRYQNVSVAWAADYNHLGPELWVQQAYFRNDRRLPGNTVVLTNDLGEGQDSFFVGKKPAYTLAAAMDYLPSCDGLTHRQVLQQIDWTTREPVLLVHGFTLGDALGGGQGTWQNFPMLIRQTVVDDTQVGLVPFEFRWRTDADFKTVAADLATVINLIHSATGKKVHVVAHSFGGVAMRVLLQRLVPGNPAVADVANNMALASQAVAGFVSLGSPYGGILGGSSRITVGGVSTALPRGRDNLSGIDACEQISCYQMGETGLGVERFLNREAFGEGQRTLAGIAAELFQTRDRLPAIPIYVGIGLRAGGERYDDGDNLISFAGQRFVSGGADDAVTARPLLAAAQVGLATVTEVVLGGPADARPGSTPPPWVPSRRDGGYKHTAVPVFGNDGGALLHAGAEAAVLRDCDDALLCTHASFQLFKRAVGDSLNLNLKDALQQAAADPRPLTLNPLRVAGRSTAEVAQLQSLLNRLRPYISGPRVLWSKAPTALVAEFNRTLGTIYGETPEVALARNQAQGEIDRFSQFQTRLLDSQNVGIVLDPANAAVLAEIMLNTIKGAAGVAQAAGLTGGVNFGNFEYDAAAKFNWMKWGKWLEAAADNAAVVDLLGSCGTALLNAASEELRIGATGQAKADTLIPVVRDLLRCVASALGNDDSGVAETFRKLAAFSSSALIIDGQEIKLAQALTEILSAVLDPLPTSLPLVSNMQGVLDVLSAVAANAEAGARLASHTSEVVGLRQDQAQALIVQLREALLARRAALIAGARTADLFVVDNGPVTNGNLRSSPSSLTSWSVSTWTFDSLLASIKTVWWDFAGAAQQTISTVVNGVSSAAYVLWEMAGNFNVTAVFKDASGTTVGGASSTAAVAAAAKPVIAGVQPLEVAQGETRVFTVQGLNLTDGMSFMLQDCLGGTEVAGTGSSTQRFFICAVPASATPGLKEGALGVQGAAGSPFARALAPFQVNVLARATPRVDTLAPLAAVAATSREFTVLGANFPAEGLTVLAPGCNGVSYGLHSATELRFTCTPAGIGTVVVDVRATGGNTSLKTFNVAVSASAAGNLTWPDSGATFALCFKADGNHVEVACSDPAAIALNDKQDGMITPGDAGMVYAQVPNTLGGSYDKTECVKDEITGLVWEGKVPGSGFRGGDAVYSNVRDGRPGELADYVAAVNAAMLCGANDWRMPTIDELRTIVHHGIDSGRPMVQPDWFPNTPAGSDVYYFSSTPYNVPFRDGRTFFLQSFHYGTSASGGSSLPGYRARLVRGALAYSGAGRYESVGDGSEVRDKRTGLIWRRCSEGMVWAAGTCTGTALGFSPEGALARARLQGQGWRVPNIKELASIVDAQAVAEPYIDTAQFPRTPSRSAYWSSTGRPGSQSFYDVYLGAGTVGNSLWFYDQHVRLVRSP